jgi:hypothetical protein
MGKEFKKGKSDVDNAFLKTINTFEKSFSSHVNKLSDKSGEDEGLFCKSLVAQIRRLLPERKAFSKMPDFTNASKF